MTYRLNAIVSIVAVISVLMVTSCDILDTGGEKEHQFNLHVNTTEPVVESSDGNTTIEISRVKMVLGDFRLINEQESQDTTIYDTLGYDKKFPRVISFTPSDVGKKIDLEELAIAEYDFVHFALHPPREGVSDSDLGSETSLLIEGSYNNSSFTYRTSIDTAVRLRISPTLQMTEHTAELDLDFLIKTETLFKSSSGGLLDPTTDAAKNRITDRLFRAFTFEEGDRTLRDYEDMRIND